MSDSEVSPEAELGKTSAKHPQGDCLEAEEVLNEDVKEEGVDGSKEDGEDDEMYDIDIDTDDERTERKDGDVWREDGVSWSGHEEACSAAARMSGSVDDEEHRIKQEAEAPEDREESHTELKESTMTEESHRSSAAEISVTSNGDLDQNPETVFQRDPFPSVDGSQNLSESCVPTTEGINESGPYKGVMETQASSGAVVLADDLKSPAMEKLDLVRKWSINTYKCTRQMLSEKLGRGSRTVDVELEAQIEILRENKKKYQHVIRLAQALASQLAQMIQTQKQLGDAFSDLSLKSPELHDEFGYNADTQKLLAKNGETLLGTINFFISSVNTLVDKTIEDTMLNIKQYEFARIEYDAYRTDLEELNLGPRDTNTLPKIEQSQQLFQAHREKYERMRNDVSVKLKFLEENKVKVLHNQLILFHNAIAAYYAGNQQQLEQTLKQFHMKLKMPGGDSPSWLEEH
ncbi:arfaptin-1 isoform X2 [Takifugu rubripes]|uniref:arfaptin-1 isoform X2 n=1 Tax=Takifugu rubripes TaxID=31033 RepID=UPI001145FC62|nr:arfaptin-1 isoform X2 [Takifugu rubripes]